MSWHGVLGASDSAEGEDTSNPGRFAGDGSGDGVSAGDGFHGEEVSEFDGVGSVKDQPILAQTSSCDHEDGGPDSVGAACWDGGGVGGSDSLAGAGGSDSLDLVVSLWPGLFWANSSFGACCGVVIGQKHPKRHTKKRLGASGREHHGHHL